AVDDLAEVDDLLARVGLDAPGVAALQQVREESDELGLLLGAARGPVAGEGAPGDLVEVEEVGGHPADLDTPLLGRGPAARRSIGGVGVGLLDGEDDARHGGLDDLAWTDGRGPHRTRDQQPGHYRLPHVRRLLTGGG